MSTPVTITLPMIRSWRPAPCYDPRRHLHDDWSGTALDLLRIEAIPPEDRLWCVLRPEVLDLRTRRLCACAIVRGTPLEDGHTVWDLLTDPRGRQVIETTEAWCRGEATDEDLEAALEAAAAAWAAAWAGDAARAAGAAAREAARDAVGDAAREAAWAARAACGMARAAQAARDAQVQIVIDVLEEVYA